MKVSPSEEVVVHSVSYEPSMRTVQVYEVETLYHDGLLEETVVIDPSIVVVLYSLVKVWPSVQVEVVVHASKVLPEIVMSYAPEVVQNDESYDPTVMTEPSESVVVLSVQVEV